MKGGNATHCVKDLMPQRDDRDQSESQERATVDSYFRVFPGLRSRSVFDLISAHIYFTACCCPCYFTDSLVIVFLIKCDRDLIFSNVSFSVFVHCLQSCAVKWTGVSNSKPYLVSLLRAESTQGL